MEDQGDTFCKACLAKEFLQWNIICQNEFDISFNYINLFHLSENYQTRRHNSFPLTDLSCVSEIIIIFLCLSFT